MSGHTSLSAVTKLSLGHLKSHSAWAEGKPALSLVCISEV